MKDDIKLIDPIELYNKPREEGEDNLIELLESYLLAGDIAAKNSNNINLEAYKRSYIMKYASYNSTVQRVILNKYLVTNLLSYCNILNVNVNAVVPLLRNDGLVDDWIALCKEFVVPFICKNNVLAAVYLHELEYNILKDPNSLNNK